MSLLLLLCGEIIVVDVLGDAGKEREISSIHSVLFMAILSLPYFSALASFHASTTSRTDSICLTSSR